MKRSEISRVLVPLRREEANAVRLYLQYKGYHWNVAGPLFRELHRLFDEHAEVVFEMIDSLAERLRILGAPAPYGLDELRRLATIPEDPHLPGAPKEMLERLLAAHRTILEGMEEGVREASESGDVGTADLFTRYIQAHQKMEWFLRETAFDRAAAAEGSGETMPASGGKSALHESTWAHPSPIPGHPLP